MPGWRYLRRKKLKDLFKAQVDWHLYRRCLINLRDIYVGIDEAFEDGISPLDLVLEVIKQYNLTDCTVETLLSPGFWKSWEKLNPYPVARSENYESANGVYAMRTSEQGNT